MKFLKNILVLVMCLQALGLSAQQDPVFSQYMFNHLVINPAYAGSRGAITTNLLYRSQWASVPGAPKTQLLSTHAPIAEGAAAVGITIVNDVIGVQKRQMINADYVYRTPLNKGHLSIGLRASMSAFQANWTEVETIEDNDAVFQQDERLGPFPNVGMGAFYQQEKFYLGFSLPQMLVKKSKLSAENKIQQTHAYLTAGFVHELNQEFKLKPSILFRSIAGRPLSMDLNLNVMYQDRIWAGLSYRPTNALVFMLEYKYNDMFRFGYAYDQNISRAMGRVGATHEFMITYDFTLERSNIRSPRYF